MFEVVKSHSYVVPRAPEGLDGEISDLGEHVIAASWERSSGCPERGVATCESRAQ